MKRQPNAMDRVAKARPAELDPPANPERRLADLARALAEPSTFTVSETRRSGPDRARPHRSRRLILGLSAAATVAAVALVAATSGSGPTTPAAVGSQKPDLDAARVLLVAADHVAAAPVTGRYWRTTTDIYGLDRTGPAKDPYLIRSVDRSQDWVSRSDSDLSLGASKSLGRKPVTAEDRAAWKRDGSPTRFTVRDPVDGEAMELPAAGTAWEKSLYDPNGEAFFVGHGMAMSAIRALPADPTRLRAFLMTDFRRNVEASRKYPLAGSWTKDSWLFNTASNLLALPVTSPVRASAYRIMASVNGVRSLGSVPDLTGRVGAAVAVQGSDRLGQFERRIIIDPATGLMMADEIRYLKTIEKLSWVKPTDVWRSTVITDIGWTNDRPPAPTRAAPPGKGVG